MLIKHSLRKALSLLLCLSMLLTTGSPIFAEEGSENPAPSNFSSQVLLSDGGDTDPDSYTLNIDALVNSISAENETYVPLDVAIVLDRSDSMSFPADSYDIKKFTSYSALENFLNTLDTNLWEGYYRATNLSSCGARFYSAGATTSNVYTSWEALRYNKSTHQWEIFITTTSTMTQTERPHGIQPDTQYGYAGYFGYWVSPKEAFDEFQTRKRYYGSNANNSDTQFSIAIPRLTKAQLTIEKFVRELNESACYLPEGQCHSVSITGFGGTLFQQGYQLPDSNVSFGSHKKEEYSCVCSAPSIPLTGGQTQYLDDFMSALKSQYVWWSTATDLAMMSVATNTRYLPPAQEGRQRVVILLTDGTPTRGMMFEDSVANEAIAYARRLKDQGVMVFTVSYMEGVTPQNGYNSAYNNTEEQKAGNFLHLISSNYPHATSMTSPGDRVSDEYFLADKGQGAELMEHFKYILNKIIPNEVSPLENGTDSLSIYHEITREFTIDQNKPVRVYVVPYQGNGTFSSTKYYIGEHRLTDTQDTAFGGEAYSLYWDHEIDKSNPDFPEADVDTSSIRLNWKDAKYAHLRENSAYYADSSYSDYTKGYRIGIEIPVVVDRNNTLGGNNILLGTEASGLYLSTTEDSTNRPDLDKLLIPEAVPNANVSFSINPGVTDYYMDMEEYLSIKDLPVDSWKVQNIFNAMYEDITVYMDNCKHDYLGITMTIYDEANQRLSEMSVTPGASIYMVPVFTGEETFDFSVDHELCLAVYVRPATQKVDSLRSPAASSLSFDIPIHYYAPTADSEDAVALETFLTKGETADGYILDINAVINNSSILPDKSDTLSIYHELTREFTVDETRALKVYIQRYKGNGQFYNKNYIGEHTLTDVQDILYQTDAYRLYWDHEINNTNPKFPEADVNTSGIRLNWTDAQYAYLRENSAYYADSSYSDYTKGYRIGIEIPVVVDRNNTLGGNNILLGTEASGLYLSTIEDGPMQPEPEKLLIQENIPNANVPITIEFGVTDYYMDMEEYLSIKDFTVDSWKVQNVFISMYGDVSIYIPNLMHQYTDIVHELYTASGELVSAQYLFAGYQRYMLPMDEYPESFDFASDHELYFKAYTSPRDGETDSTGAPTIKSDRSYLPARYYAPTYEASPVEIKHTLNLESDISLNYLVAGASLSAYKEYYMTVEFCGETIRLEPEVKGNVTYFTLKNITAVDLTEEIRGTLHLFTEEGFYHCEEDVYSVADYAYGQLGKDAASAGLKTLCANLLRYGTLAQSYKGHNGKPADGDMSATHKSYLSDLSSVTANKITEALGDVDNGIPWVGKSLILDSKVSVKSIFSLADFSGSKEDLNLRVSYTDVDGEYVDIRIRAMETYSEEAQLYAFTLDTLLATEMRTPLTMALYNGDQQVSETQLYSVESYVSGRSGLLLELGKALLAYSDSARSFFAD